MIDEPVRGRGEDEKAVEVAMSALPASARVALIRECSRSSSSITARRPPCSSSRPSRRPRPAPSSSALRQVLDARHREGDPQADLGVNPSMTATSSGVSCLRSPRSGARYIKMAKHEAEEARVSVRNIRRHARKRSKFVKDGEVGGRWLARGEKDLEQLTRVRRPGRRPGQAQGSRAPRGLSVEPGPETTTSDQPSGRRRRPHGSG